MNHVRPALLAWLSWLTWASVLPAGERAPAGPPAGGRDAASAAVSPEAIQQLRRQAAARRRPLIVHADGRPMNPADDEIEKGEAPLIFPHLPGTSTSALTYSLIHQFNVARLYRSQVADEWPPGYVHKLYGDGPDGLEVYIDLCRKNGYEAWFAMRANDTHDAAASEHGRMRWESCLFKQRHPELLLGSRDNPPPCGRWSGLDFAQPLVREQVYRILEEVCQKYDIDGVQIDFFRHLNLFKSVSWGGKASAGEAAMLTDLMRRLRALLDREGARRGRPILFCVRTPDSPDYALAVGLDVRTWLQEQLVDAWAVGGYFQLRDWSDSVRLAHRHGVQAWVSLDESRLTIRPGEDTSDNAWRHRGVNSVEGYRGRALNAWRAGFDSVILFNFFVLPDQPHFALLSELHDPRRLAGLDQLYVADPLGTGGTMGPARWLKDGETYFTRPVFRSGPLAPGQTATVHLEVADDPARTAGGRPARVSLQVLAAGVTEPGELDVRLNETPLTPEANAAAPWTCTVDPAAVKSGKNLVRVTLRPGAAAPATLEDVHLWIRPQ